MLGAVLSSNIFCILSSTLSSHQLCLRRPEHFLILGSSIKLLASWRWHWLAIQQILRYIFLYINYSSPKVCMRLNSLLALNAFEYTYKHKVCRSPNSDTNSVITCGWNNEPNMLSIFLPNLATNTTTQFQFSRKRDDPHAALPHPAMPESSPSQSAPWSLFLIVHEVGDSNHINLWKTKNSRLVQRSHSNSGATHDRCAPMWATLRRRFSAFLARSTKGMIQKLSIY